MAKSIPRVIKWGFNPNTSKLEALRDPQDRIIWAVLRMGHIVDQDFNGQVAEFAANLRNRPPQSGLEMFDRAWNYGLHGYGVDSANAPYRADLQWWDELLEAWRGNLVLQHEWPGKPAPLHRGRPAHGGYPGIVQGASHG